MNSKRSSFPSINNYRRRLETIVGGQVSPRACSQEFLAPALLGILPKLFPEYQDRRLRTFYEYFFSH